ncbi:MAG: hypothetical protein P4L42_02630 [Desulfocapsaceae bacterium]|nr:hypothetical protein [Desulfocapsaceae bacterium]
MNQQYHRKKRNFFLKKDLQGKIILAVFISVLGSSLIFLMLFGFFSADTMTIIYSNNSLQMGQTPIILLKKAIEANWILLIVVGSLLVFLALMGSHRIAGPLFRFEQSLDRMDKGNLNDKIHLRNTDEGKDLAYKINNFNLILSRKIREISQHASAVDDVLPHLQEGEMTKLSRQEIEALIQTINTNNQKIIEITSYFILADE